MLVLRLTDIQIPYSTLKYSSLNGDASVVYIVKWLL